MKAIGIDLGTTNSVAAYFNGMHVEVLANRDGTNLTPSVVSFEDSQGSGEWLVGQPAINYAELAPEDTIFSIKRLMGLAFSNEKIQKLSAYLPYQIVQSSDEEQMGGIKVLINGKPYSPVEISAKILKEIKIYAERDLGEPISHAVITVPAYFDEYQRAATREAGHLAGFVVKMVISEPVAAAIAYGLTEGNEEGKQLLVFDLGGGTFDISLIEITDNIAHVIKHGGDNWLGGDDFDKEITRIIIKNVIETYGIDPSTDKTFMYKAKKAAQKAKEALSYRENHKIIFNHGGYEEGKSRFSVNISLSRVEFENMIMQYIDESVQKTLRLIEEKELERSEITDIILVGGSSLIPAVQEQIQNQFPLAKIRSNINPMECVARGASILATKTEGVQCPECEEINNEENERCTECNESLALAVPTGEFQVVDRTAKPLGVCVVKENDADVFEIVIPEDTIYPLNSPRKRQFYATKENQEKIKVPVYQGFHKIASHNVFQGDIEWDLPNGIRLEKGEPIEVIFNYDRNEILYITLRASNRKDVSYSTELKRDQPPMQASKKAEPITEIKWEVEARNILDAAERFIIHYKDFIPEEMLTKLRANINKLNSYITENNEPQGRSVEQKILMSMIAQSGVATQLYLAEKAKRMATKKVAADLEVTISNLKKAHKKDNEAEIKELTKKLTVLRNQARHDSVPIIESKKEIENLLETR